MTRLNASQRIGKYTRTSGLTTTVPINAENAEKNGEGAEKPWSDFEKLHSHTGRPSIPPERLLRALLLQVLYSIRSERMLMEQLDYNLLFRWFVGLSMDDGIWDPTVFTKNRDRLLRGPSQCCSSSRCWPKRASAV